MENNKDASVEHIFTAVQVLNGIREYETPTYAYLKGSTNFDPGIKGLGILSMDVTLPIAEKSLSEQTVQQLQQQMLSWLAQAIRRESLQEWFELQRAEPEQSSDQSPPVASLSPEQL